MIDTLLLMLSNRFDLVGYAQRLQKCAGDRPVYFDEPNRSGWSGNDYPASDFIAACGKAKAVGIAAWCLHTNAGFVLHDRSFQSQLTASEQEAITEIGKL